MRAQQTRGGENQQDLQSLIAAIQRVDLEIGRAMAVGLVHGLPIDDFVRGLILNRIAHQETTADLLRLLRDLDAWHSRSRSTPASPAPPAMIPVHDSARGEGVWRFVPAADIAYAVVGEGIKRIRAGQPNVEKPATPAHVVVRTATGFWPTPYRSIAAFLARVRSDEFVQVNNRSTALRVDKIFRAPIGGAVKFVEIGVAANVLDTVLVSRRPFADIRDRLGLPRAERRRKTSPYRPRPRG